MSTGDDPSDADGDEAAQAFFAGHAFPLAVYRRVCEMLDSIGPTVSATTRSQVAFRRRRGFAYLWMPGRWLTRPGAEVVLSVALARRDESPRWKEVVNPSRGTWMHHLEVHSLGDLDDEVDGWLREAFDDAV
jgi:hypothetical protein